MAMVTVLGYQKELFQQVTVTSPLIHSKAIPALKCLACGQIFVGSQESVPAHACSGLYEPGPSR